LRDFLRAFICKGRREKGIGEEGKRADQPRWEERGKGVIRYAVRSSNGERDGRLAEVGQRGLSHAGPDALFIVFVFDRYSQ
jgi:hypothetical protein